MSAEETLYVKSRTQWRRWLKTRGTKKPEIWLIYYKKHTGQPSIPYDHAVEEAICFGWIDTTVRRIDEERYMQRFTPRRRNSQWSALNRRRAEALLEKGDLKEYQTQYKSDQSINSITPERIIESINEVSAIAS